MMKANSIRDALIYIVIGGIVGYFIRSVIYTDTSSSLQVISGNKNFPYISQRLDSESLNETTQGQIVIIKNRVNQLIRESIDRADVTQVSVYYRDLNNGPWMGVNEKDGFSPASLLKVPILMGVYRLADTNKSFLSKKVTNNISSDGVVPDFIPSKHVSQGDNYTIDDLVSRMIIYSDNDAKNLLLSQLKTQDLDQIYKDLGLVVPGIVKLEDNMSVRSYASFFRVLYNGSYLSRELSNKALTLLTQSEFNKGLVAGIPRSIKIAHKFGERAFNNGIKQLHDCGIIYYADKPYVLCVMTRGRNWDKLSHIIKNISQITFEEVTGK